jgi:hypothetical protein
MEALSFPMPDQPAMRFPSKGEQAVESGNMPYLVTELKPVSTTIDL